MTGAAGVRARNDKEDSELVKCVGEMSKAVTSMVNGMTDEKDSDNLKDLVQSQIKEKMKDTKETLARILKCVEELCELMTPVVKKNGMDLFK